MNYQRIDRALRDHQEPSLIARGFRGSLLAFVAASAAGVDTKQACKKGQSFSSEGGSPSLTSSTALFPSTVVLRDLSSLWDLESNLWDLVLSIGEAQRPFRH
jgi:hypothetical protein